MPKKENLMKTMFGALKATLRWPYSRQFSPRWRMPNG